MLLPDTNILIYVADGYRGYRELFLTLNMSAIALSCLTVAELEASIYTEPEKTISRELLTRPLLTQFTHLPFTPEAASLYGQIVRQAGYSRRKALDRMLAAQALSLSATLITANAADFADIPGLQIEAW